MLKQILGGRKSELWSLQNSFELHNPRTPHIVGGNPMTARTLRVSYIGLVSLLNFLSDQSFRCLVHFFPCPTHIPGEQETAGR